MQLLPFHFLELPLCNVLFPLSWDSPLKCLVMNLQAFQLTLWPSAPFVLLGFLVELLDFVIGLIGFAVAELVFGNWPLSHS